MAAEKIGQCKCWLCGSDKAGVTVSKAGLCVVTCNACHAQTFARGSYADTMIRQSMRPIARAVAEAVEQIGREVKSLAEVRAKETAKELKEPDKDVGQAVENGVPARVEKPARRGFGFFAEV